MRHLLFVALVLASACRKQTVEARELERLRVEQRALQAQIAVLQATVDELRRRQTGTQVIVRRDPPRDLPPGGHIARSPGGRLVLSGTGPSDVPADEPTPATPTTPAADEVPSAAAAPSIGKPGEVTGLLDQLHDQMEQLKRSQAAQQQALDEIEKLGR